MRWGDGWRASGARGRGPRYRFLQLAPGTMWAQGPGPRVLGACLSRLTWLSPVVLGPGPPSDLGRWPPRPQQLDPENTGFIGADTFAGLVHRHELPLDPAKLDMLVALAQSNERGQVCYQELVDLVSATVGGQLGCGRSALAGVGWAGGPSSLPFPLGRAIAMGQGFRPCDKLGGPLRRDGHGGSMVAYA